MAGCKLCPRECGAERSAARGACGASDEIKVARAALHFWEEPCISGKNGSGAVFFCGCPLGCVFCQNREISRGNGGKTVSVERLAQVFLELQAQNAHNINLVTSSCYVHKIAAAIRQAKQEGLHIPVVYNSSAYEKPEALRLLSGLIDVYLPDFKYFSPEVAEKFASAPDYPAVAKAAIAEMARQQPKTVFRRGIIQKGVVIRHLILPSHTADSKRILEYLHRAYGNGVYLSIMNQYTPIGSLPYPELERRLSKHEYDSVLDYAIGLGIEKAYIQQGKTASESFIPEFDNTGI